MLKRETKDVYWADRLVCDALRFLRDSDGSASAQDVREHLEKKSNIPADKKELSDVTGKELWKGGLDLQTIRYVRAGLMRRAKGVWHITPLGEEILSSESDEKIAHRAKSAQQKKERLRQNQPKSPSRISDREMPDEPSGPDEGKADGDIVVGDQMEEYYDSANEGISGYIKKMDPFAFQDLVAALFRGMGYYVHPSMVSPKNTADGGIDIIAYQHDDPIGAKTPRIKAQVKQRSDAKASEKELRELLGTMSNENDIAVFISTAGFARGCNKFARQQGKQLELIDMPRFIELWRDNYSKLSDEDKSLLPLQPIYFFDAKRAKRS